jgi:hypothetical protein
LLGLDPQVGHLAEQQVVHAADLPRLRDLLGLHDALEALLLEELVQLRAFDHVEPLAVDGKRRELVGGDLVQLLAAPLPRRLEGRNAGARGDDARGRGVVPAHVLRELLLGGRLARGGAPR